MYNCITKQNVTNEMKILNRKQCKCKKIKKCNELFFKCASANVIAKTRKNKHVTIWKHTKKILKIEMYMQMQLENKKQAHKNKANKIHTHKHKYFLMQVNTHNKHTKIIWRLEN